MKTIRITDSVHQQLVQIRDYPDEPLWHVIKRLLEGEIKRPPQAKTSRKPSEKEFSLWPVWSEAYRERYGVDHPRNAKVNSLLKVISDRLGQDAEPVIRFYLESNDAWLLKTKHALGNLAKEPEIWHVRWQAGQTTISDRLAREAERAATAQDEMKVAMKKIEVLFEDLEDGGYDE